MKIAFLGLGRMGHGMARNLLRAGHELTVYNRSAEKAQAFAAAEKGAQAVSTPAEACAEADAAITMLADDAAVLETVLGEHGVLEGLPTGAVHISSSTISPATVRRLTTEHDQRNQHFLSAPVFGRPDAAEAKKLLVVAAGDHALIEKYLPVLDALGRRTFLAAVEPWQANAIKLCGNFMIASMMETFAEAFATLEKAGVDRHQFLDIVVELFGSPVYKNYGTIIANRDFTEKVGFALPLGLKDARLALELAQEVQAPLPLASLIRDHFLSALANGQEHMDWSSLALVADRNAGLTPSR